MKSIEYEKKIESIEESKLNLQDFMKNIANILIKSPNLFPRTFLSFSPDDLIHFLHDIGINLTHDQISVMMNEFSLSKPDKLAKDFDANKFIESLRINGFTPLEEPGFKSSRSDSKTELIFINHDQIKENITNGENKLDSEHSSNKDLSMMHEAIDEFSSKSSSGSESQKSKDHNKKN